MIVMKFGGTSCGSAEALKRVAHVVRRAQADPAAHEVVVVVSALSGVTDMLLGMAEAARTRSRSVDDMLAQLHERHATVCHALGLGAQCEALLEPLDVLREVLPGIWYLRELSPRSKDFVVTHGEVLSSRIVAAFLTAEGVRAHPVTGWDAGIVTDAQYGEAGILEETWTRIPQQLPLATGSVPVVTGFMGQTLAGERTTLGRGGSDYTAAILGRALGASEIQIWTDVNGILSSDPRLVQGTFTLPELTFEEAAELAYFGAKVIHPKTIEPAVHAGIPVRVLNTFEADHPGTVIVRGPRRTIRQVVGMACKKGQVILALDSSRMLAAEGFLARVFAVLERHRVSVDTISTSEVSVCMTVEPKYEPALRSATAELETIAHVEIRPGRAIICCVGQGMRERPGTAGKIFSAVHQADVNVEMISMGSSKINITFVVRDEDANTVMRELHARLIAIPPEPLPG